MMLKVSKPSQQELLEFLNYDPLTGIVTWKKAKSNRVRIGDVAGNRATPGHLQIKFNGQTLQLHAVIWCMVYGYWPDLLDHEDTAKTNNRLNNLREATSVQNAQNRNIRSDNISAYKGVNKKPNGRYRARIWNGAKNITLGTFATPKEAAEAYDKAAINVFGQFALTNRSLGLL